jgi:chromosome segregation ATPase
VTAAAPRRRRARRDGRVREPDGGRVAGTTAQATGPPPPRSRHERPWAVTVLPRIRLVARSSLERRLSSVAERLKRLRVDLGIADEQLAHLVDEADDARVRALVSETPLAEQEHREARRQVEVMARHRDALSAEIAQLEASQDTLLDQMLERT